MYKTGPTTFFLIVNFVLFPRWSLWSAKGGGGPGGGTPPSSCRVQPFYSNTSVGGVGPVFHAHSMTKPLALPQSVCHCHSRGGGGGGGSSGGCQVVRWF